MQYKPLSKLFAALLAIGFCAYGCGSSADIPAHVPGKITKAWAAARHDWTMEAQLTHVTFTRDEASKPFDSDITFMAASRAKLYHVKEGPKGSSASETAMKYQPVLSGKIIDLPQAVDTARKHGMKGNVVTAELMAWLPYGSSVVVEVWRIIPDNDPNTADPNDPNMKNYFIDAVTGAFYRPTNPDEKLLQKGHNAMNNAVADDMMAFAKSLHP